MEECWEFGVVVNGNGVNVDLATVTGVYVESNLAEDVECHENIKFCYFV